MSLIQCFLILVLLLLTVSHVNLVPNIAFLGLSARLPILYICFAGLEPSVLWAVLRQQPPPPPSVSALIELLSNQDFKHALLLIPFLCSWSTMLYYVGITSSRIYTFIVSLLVLTVQIFSF